MAMTSGMSELRLLLQIILMSDCNQIVDVLQGKEPESRSFLHKLVCSHQTVIHENQLSVQKIQERSQQLQIKNHLATNAQGKLVKVTQIYLEDRVIKITDLFTPLPDLQPDPNPCISSSNPTPWCNTLPSQNRLPSQAAHRKLKHARSAKRTIFRHFQNWIAKNSPTELNLLEKLRALIEREGLRRDSSLIVRMAKEPLLQEAFLMFSQNEGQYLVSSSKTHGKKSYSEALQRYRGLCMKRLEGEIKQSSKELDSEEVFESRSNKQDQDDS